MKSYYCYRRHYHGIHCVRLLRTERSRGLLIADIVIPTRASPGRGYRGRIPQDIHKIDIDPMLFGDIVVLLTTALINDHEIYLGQFVISLCAL